MPVDMMNRYTIDTSQLFKLHSKNAVDWVTDYMGGFDRLTDMCCHIAMSMIKRHDHDEIIGVITQATQNPPIGIKYVDMTHKVLWSYATVLHTYFLSIACVGINLDQLNYVEIHDAQLLNNGPLINVDMSEVRASTTLLTATFHWHH